MTKTIKKILIAALMVASFTLVFKVSDVSAATPKVHTVTFFYGTKCFAEPVFHGANAIAPTDTYVAGYNFLGWVGGSLFNVTEDRVCLGSYAACPAPVVYCTPTTKEEKHDDECWCHKHSCWYRHRCPWCDDWYEWMQQEWREEKNAYKEYWDSVNQAKYDAIEELREEWREENKDWRWHHRW